MLGGGEEKRGLGIDGERGGTGWGRGGGSVKTGAPYLHKGNTCQLGLKREEIYGEALNKLVFSN